MTAPGTPRSPGLDRLLGVLFLALLAAPGLVALVRGEANVARAGKIERRRPTPPPKLGAAGFAHDFDDWFEDAWGGREHLLRVNARLSRDAFGTSPAGYLVFGRDDWIFSRESRSFESFTGVDPLGQERLRAWQRTLEDRRQWLAERGIAHRVVFVPHKSSIYPEKLPRAVEAARGTSRLEEFQRWMAEHSEVEVVDVAPALIAAKAADGPRRHVYSPQGVHWSAIGAHAAYEVIARDLEASHGAPPPRPLDAFELVDQDAEGDSWASRMLLDGVIDMENLLLVPKGPTGVVDAGVPPGGTPRDHAATRPEGGGPRVLMVHDSFGPDIRRLIAMQASAIEARWRPHLERAVVERVRPDVVIELYSELALVTQTPFRRAEFLGLQARAAYDAAPVARRIDLSRPLDLEGEPGRVATSLRGGEVEVRVLRGVGYLALGELPAGAPGSELLLGLRVRCETPGTLAVFVAPAFGSGPTTEELQPVEVSAEASLAIVPLLPRARGARAWIVLPRSLGAVTLSSVEYRLAPPAAATPPD